MSTLPAPRLVARSLTELGRIRAGDVVANKSGKGTHPRSLLHWRLTSKDRGILELMAKDPAIGGTVRRWEGERVQGVQYELYTETETLAICVPTFKPIRLDYELWSAAGCQRRCDGLTVQRCPLTPALVGQPCQCPEDDSERATLAAKGKACNRVLRVWVLLPDVPGVGFWRLESHGFYAASELLGQLAVWQQAGMHSGIIEGRLRLEQREQKRPGAETLQYVVPVFTTAFTLRQLALAAQTQQGFLVQPSDKPLLPMMHAAQHADDIFGPGAGDRLRVGMPATDAEVIDLTPEPPQTSTVLDNTAALRTAIEQLLTAQGLDDEARHGWLQKQARDAHIPTWEQMPVERLRTILARLEDAVRKAEAKRAREDARQDASQEEDQAPDPAPRVLADEELGDWRARLLQLNLDTLALLDGTQDPEYAAYVRETCARAETVLRSPDTTEDDQVSWHDLLCKIGDKLSKQMGMEF